MRLHVHVDTAPRLRQALIHGSIDLVFLIDRLSENPRLHTLHHSHAEIQFIACPDSPYAQRPVCIEELTASPWILTERGTNYRKKLEDDLAERRLYLHDRVEIGTSKTIIDFVAAGIGISILPAVTVADAVRAGRVAVLDVTDYQIHMDLQILAAGERWLPHPLALLAGDFAAGLAAEG